MLVFRDYVRIVGFVVFAAGLGCLPLAPGVNPKRDTSAFERASDTGIFLHLGLVLIAAGLLVVIISYILPPRGE